MKKQNLYVSIVIIIVAIALGIYLMRRNAQAPATAGDTASTITGDRTIALSCDANKGLSITFHLPEDKSADVALSDGRMMNLLNTSSAAGSSYTSADGKTMLALDGNVLNLTESGTKTYTNCSVAAGTAGTQTPAPAQQ